MRVANLVVIGVSKAGTTSLFDYLGRHPEVGQSDVKETRWLMPARYGEELGPREEYARHFSALRAERYAVEATPGYFYGGGALAKEMQRVCGPEVRAVVSLREPADRCWSWYRFMKARVRIPRETTFEEYVERCLVLHEKGEDALLVNQAWWGVGGGCYSEWMDEWDTVMGDRLKVLYFEDLVASPEDVMADVFRWLGLDPGVSEGELGAENQTVGYRLRALQRAAVKVNRRGERVWREHPELKRRLRSAYYSVNRAGGVETMGEGVRARLREFYAPGLERLCDEGLVLPESWGGP